MKFDKNCKSVVITYDDEECVRLTGQEARKFQKIIREYVSTYRTALLDSKYSPDRELVDITKDLNFEVIRNGMKADV